MWKISGCLIKILLISHALGDILQHSKNDITEVQYQYEIEKWLNSVNIDLAEFNSLAAHITWKLATEPDEKTSIKARNLGVLRNRWRNEICQLSVNGHLMSKEQKRKLFLLCRGPKFSDTALIDFLRILGELALEYNAEVCLKNSNTLIHKNTSNFPNPEECLYGEPHLERLMKRIDLTPSQLKWIWINWHDSVGPRVKNLFDLAVKYQNEAAVNNGYRDIGEAWREELEIPNLEELVMSLYHEIKPFYSLLHAVVRHKLVLKYGAENVNPKGPIPIHLLGNMWGQDWSTLIDYFSLTPKTINLDQKMKQKKISIKDMVLEAEDFYTSLSLPKMTTKFWKYSVFEENNHTLSCHGTAANLYNEDDFRIIMCGKTSMEDLYVIHHEMGHIEYYKAYSEQPSVFQNGANAAIHESIGDAIMHGVMTSEHLHRLNLLTDDQLVDKDTLLFLLFQQALAKIPEIPFSLIIDKFRWEIFRGNIPKSKWNEYYWYLNEKYRGIIPPSRRPANGFDAGAKFHIPDNTPYIRYFLSSIMQMQIFKSLCGFSFYGTEYNESLYIPLDNCDIYGSKVAGKKLLDMLTKGASINWSEALRIVSGTEHISVQPLLQYYEKVYIWLKNYTQSNNIYVGW